MNATSKRNVAVVECCNEAFNRADVPSILATLHPAVRWEENDPASTFIGLHSVYHGHDGFRRWFQETAVEVWDEFRAAHTLLSAGGDDVVLSTRLRGRGRDSGIEVEMRHFQVVSLRDGQIVRRRSYRRSPAALEAAHAGIHRPNSPNRSFAYERAESPDPALVHLRRGDIGRRDRVERTLNTADHGGVMHRHSPTTMLSIAATTLAAAAIAAGCVGSGKNQKASPGGSRLSASAYLSQVVNKVKELVTVPGHSFGDAQSQAQLEA